MSEEKNHLIQCYRGIICFLVIQNHMWPVQNWFYHFTWGITGASMGLFLLISGYFMHTQIEEKQLERLKKRILDTFLLTVQVLGFYYIIKLIPMAVTGNLSDYISKYLAPTKLFQLIFPNSTVICGPMWYLISLLYSTILLYVLVKFRLEEKIGCFIPLLLFLCLCLSGEFKAVLPKVAPEYARVFLIHGFPFILGGFLFHKHEAEILKRIKPYLKPQLLVLFFAAVSLESTVVGCNVLSVSSILFSFSLLSFAILQPQIGMGTFLERVGTQNSLHIYLIHWCFTSMAVRVLSRFPSMHWAVTYFVAILLWLLCIVLSQIYLFIRGHCVASIQWKHN